MSANLVRAPLECCGITLTDAVEDYLRTIFKLYGRNEPATTSALARHLGVAPPTVSVMLKRLAANDLINRSDNRLVELTAHGERHALDVTRRHRLVEAFLVQALGVPWDQADAEAEVLEHAISNRLEERIDAALGHPTHDPHGDPIPQPTGEHVETWAAPLAKAEAGSCFRVERVCDRDSAALRFLSDRDIRPGVVLEVIEREPFGGPLWVEVEGRRHPLGPVLADAGHGRTS
jgi:DtxR family Mn-dependent transcriptional regulator